MSLTRPDGFAPLTEPDAPVAADPGGRGGVRLRLFLAYDGTHFSGWARQRGQRTVQEVVEQALATVLRLEESADLTVAGRTDAGVHARSQVAHVDVPVERWHSTDSVVRRMAGVLPADVRLRLIEPAPRGFDARFSPLWRRYVYRVCTAEGGGDPLRRHEVLRHPRPLVLDRLHEAAAVVVGEHDFAAFCRRREGATTIREVLEASWEEPAAEFFQVQLRADAFCHSMVRSLVGAMLAVGEGRRDARWLAETLQGAVRKSDVQVLPPHGLTLEEVAYPDDSELAARAVATRRVRSLPT